MAPVPPANIQICLYENHSQLHTFAYVYMRTVRKYNVNPVYIQISECMRRTGRFHIHFFEYIPSPENIPRTHIGTEPEHDVDPEKSPVQRHLALSLGIPTPEPMFSICSRFTTMPETHTHTHA